MSSVYTVGQLLVYNWGVDALGQKQILEHGQELSRKPHDPRALETSELKKKACLWFTLRDAVGRPFFTPGIELCGALDLWQ